MASNPVNVATGNKYQEATDFRSGGAQPLEFRRHYNSQAAAYEIAGVTFGLLGLGWSSTYDRRLSITWSSGIATSVIAQRPDGRFLSFSESSGVLVGPADIDATLVQVGNTLEYRSPAGETETYDDTGRLLTIRWRGGYEQTLQYDANGELESITDSFGRQLLLSLVDGRIDTMTDPDGRVYLYRYRNLQYLGRGPLKKVIYPDDTPLDDSDNPFVKYLYEDARHPYALTGIVDENGVRYATWAYDDFGRATLSEHAGGADHTTIAYDDTDGSRTVTNALGKQTVYRFSTIQGVPRVTEVEGLASVNCLGSTVANTYNTNGYVISSTDRNGNVTTYVRDSRGLESSRTEAVGTPEARTITTAWHPTYRVPTQIVEPGRTTDLTYDADGRLTQRTLTDTTSHTIPYSTNGEVRTWTYSYTAEGLLTSVDGPRAGVTDVTTYDYDLLGNLTKVTTALGHETQVTAYTARGLPLTLLDANGISTDLDYDERGRLLSRTVDPGPDQAVTSFTYDEVGQVTDVTLPDGATLTYVYDDARRLTEISNALGEKIVYTLDTLGNRTQEQVLSATGAILRTQSRIYDELGRLLREIGAASQETNYGYDLEDNLVSTIDPVGSVTEHAYDALNRLVETTDDALGATTYAYDARDNLTGVTDPRGLTTQYTRNAFGEAIQVDSPDTGITVYGYDSAGNLVQETDARGAVIDYAYDVENRALSKSFPADPALDVTYGYDDATAGRHGIGRLTSITDSTGWSEFSYDARGNLTLERRNIGGVTYDTSYAYDAADRLVEMVYPWGRIVTYERDLLGRVSGVTTEADEFAPAVTLASNIDYLAFGPLAALDLGNGLDTALSYDQDFRLTGLVTGDAVTSVQDLAYGYDLASNITAITDNLDITRDQSFQYDDLHRLTQALGPYGQIDYGYDAVGNRTDRTITEGAAVQSELYSYDAFSNRLTSVDDGAALRSFAYTPAGDLELDDRGAGADLDLSYDQAGRLAAVAENGLPKTSALYNAEGERCVMVANDAITHSLYDGDGRLIGEYDAGSASAPPGSSEIVLDNGDPGTSATGTWASASTLPGYHGGDYVRYDGPGDPDSYDWTPILPDANGYAVYAKWPPDLSRGMSATYTVRHDGGETAVSVDQKQDGGDWSLLGLFDMTPGLGQGVTLAARAEAVTAEADIVVDNLSPGVGTVGSWGQSTNISGYWDTNYAVHAAGSGTNQFIWPAAVPEGGRYKVYVRWTQSVNRATDAKYTVHHAAGADTITVNQEVNGGIWMLLGAFDLDPAEDHKVVLSDDANDKVIADAVRFLRDSAAVPAEEIVIDNSDPQVSVQGAWTAGTSTDGGLFLGTDFLKTDPGATVETVTWTPTLASSGHYKVYARWTEKANRATDAPYTVHHAGGQTTIDVNQEVNGGAWVLLGSFDLAPGQNHRVVLSNDADDKVIADAVKLVRSASAASAGEIVVDNTDAGATIQGAWTSATGTDGGLFWGADFLKSDPGSGAESVTWTPNLASAGQYRIYARWSAKANRATNAPYTVHHAGGQTTIDVNQEVNGGDWVALGNFELAPGQNHRVVLSDDADEKVVADAVKFVLDGGSQAVVADAVKFERAVSPAFREFVTLEGRPLALIEGGVVAWVHADHLGTPQAMTDGAGALTWERIARPFGETHAESGPAANPQRFPGQRHDEETGLAYNYFRDYDPSLGRYVESDPIGLRGGVNTYAYALSDPIGRTDVFGLQSGAVPAPSPFPSPAGHGVFWPGSPENKAFHDSTLWMLNAIIEFCTSQEKPCPPCRLEDGTIVPLGTIAYRWDKVPSDVKQHGIYGDHLNLYKANQNPNNCQCFWQPQKAVKPPPQPDWIPIQPFAN